MGRRKRLLREKRKAKHRRMAMRGLQYRIKLGIKEFFRMRKIVNTYWQRLTTAAAKRNPLPMAVITYQAYRDSDSAMILKEAGNKMNYDAECWKATLRMAKILETIGWEDSEMTEFLQKSKELLGINNEKQNDL